MRMAEHFALGEETGKWGQRAGLAVSVATWVGRRGVGGSFVK